MSDDTEGFWHTVQQGESTTSLAFDHGLFWEKIWTHPENSKLRRDRVDQNVLYPGDEIFIPVKELKHHRCSTEKSHTFVKKGVPEKLTLRFLDLEQKPLAGKPYLLRIDGTSLRGNLDADGWLKVNIPPNARQGHIKLGDHGEWADMDLQLGHLDPLKEITGIQGRLKNLGYYDGPIDGESSESMEEAILRFRKEHQLEESTIVDDTVRDKLRQLHGV